MRCECSKCSQAARGNVAELNVPVPQQLRLTFFQAFMVAHTTPPHRLGDHPFLAPVVDLLNHSPDAKMAWHLGSSPEGMPPQTRFGGDDTLHSTVETGHSAAGMVEMSGDAFRVFALEPPHGDANAVGREVFNHYDALPNHRFALFSQVNSACNEIVNCGIYSS